MVVYLLSLVIHDLMTTHAVK